ncbi:MAG TPA: hypothetical protein DCM05_13865 [Elusimicrobia bacterium]|nr:hypothetical protein [Elusimicrobiota bacterium]
MKDKSGWVSFVIAGLIYVAGYRVVTGEMPGAAGALKWYSVVSLLLLWGAVSAVMAKLSRP